VIKTILKKGVFENHAITVKEIKKFTLLADLFFFLNMVDVGTTGLALSYTGIYETNPIIEALISVGFVWFMLFKCVFVLGIIYTLRYLYAINIQLFSRKLIVTSMLIFIVAMLVCCVNNVYWILKLM